MDAKLVGGLVAIEKSVVGTKLAVTSLGRRRMLLHVQRTACRIDGFHLHCDGSGSSEALSSPTRSVQYTYR